MIREIINEHLMFKKQILRLAKMQIIAKYKGAFLGPLWAVLSPAFTIFIYWFVFSIGLRNADRAVNGVPFLLFLIVGIVPWFYMRDSIKEGAACMRKNSSFITKTKFPVSTIMTYSLLSNYIIHLCLMVIIVIILQLYQYSFTIYYIQFFYYSSLMYLFTLFLSWSLSPLSAVSKDVFNTVKSIIPALFWLSGIIWNAYDIDNEFLRKLITSSPVCYISNGYRNTFLFKKWFFEQPFEMCVFWIWMIVIFILGIIVYKRLRKVIPDVL